MPPDDRRARFGGGTAFVGSSNLSASALTTAVEWNYRVLPSTVGGGFEETVAAFESLFGHSNAKPLDADWIDRYRQFWTANLDGFEKYLEKLQPEKKEIRPDDDAPAHTHN